MKIAACLAEGLDSEGLAEVVYVSGEEVSYFLWLHVYISL